MRFQGSGLIAVIYGCMLLLMLSGCQSVVEPQQTLKLSHARYGHAVVNDGQNIYVFGGANSNGYVSELEIFDLKSGKVEVLDNITLPRVYFSAVFDGKHSIYLLGGNSLYAGRRKMEQRVEVFDIRTRTISYVNKMPMVRVNASVVYLNEQIFVFGGDAPQSSGMQSRATVARYDIKSDQWQRMSDMPTAKATRAVVKDGQIYVVGGYDQKNQLSAFERYDPSTDQWQTLAPLPFVISAHSAAIWQQQLWLFGDYNTLDATYRYDFNSKNWQKMDIGYQASRHNSVTILNDQAYVIGGNVGGNGAFLDNIQVFMP